MPIVQFSLQDHTWIHSCVTLFLVPPNQLYTWNLRKATEPRSLIHELNPSRTITAFTLTFWMQAWDFPVGNTYDFACYGSGSGCDIRLSLMPNLNLRVRINDAM